MLGHPVHPVEPAAPDHSEFVNLGPKIRIRAIHIKPRDDIVFKEHYPCFNFNNKRLSLSEEYWFTRWNKPLKTGICNCSFRRSLRYSAIIDLKNNESVLPDVKENRLSNYDTPATRITNVETFVERLVQETLFEALQEYVMSKDPRNVKRGISNKGFAMSPDDTDGILLRRRSASIKSSCDNAAVLPTDCVTVHATQSSAVQNKNLNPKGAICEHRITANNVNVRSNYTAVALANGLSFFRSRL